MFLLLVNFVDDEAFSLSKLSGLAGKKRDITILIPNSAWSHPGRLITRQTDDSEKAVGGGRTRVARDREGRRFMRCLSLRVLSESSCRSAELVECAWDPLCVRACVRLRQCAVRAAELPAARTALRRLGAAARARLAAALAADVFLPALSPQSVSHVCLPLFF